MSYYNIHPIFGHRASSPAPSPYRLHSPPGLRHPTPPRATEYDIDAEEQAAIAHLRRIQQRREAQQASIEREAAIRFQAEQERELAIRRAIAEKRRELAIAEAIEQQREKEAERARIHAAIQHHHLRQQAEQQHRQRIAEQQRIAQLHAAQQLRQQQIAQARERAARCAAKYAQRATQQVAKEVKKEYKDEYAALNNLLGGLFGISIEDETAKDVQPKHTAPAPTPAPAQAQATPTPVTAPAPAPAAAAASTEPFPSDINNLLSHFLGLRIEPASSADEPKSTASAESAEPAQPNQIPEGLNEFLSNFGLVFEPMDSQQETKPAECSSSPAVPAPVQQKVETPSVSVADPPEPTLPAPSTRQSACAQACASSSARACPRPEVDDHPLTTYLNGMADMPPFVRDILGNVEMAFKEERDRSNQAQGQKAEAEVKGKGKAVAEGEKKTTPVPAPATTAPATTAPATTATPIDTTVNALSTLSNISSELDLVRRSFDFPSKLSFATPSPDTSSPPALLFNKANSGYHAQAHKLLQLLLSADAITSDGNKDVRRKRKEVVRSVEEEIEGLEKKRDQVWEEVKAQREQGEVEAETASSSSCDSSVVDPAEVKEEIEHHEESEPVTGFEVPVTETQPTSAPAPEISSATTDDTTSPSEAKSAGTSIATPAESTIASSVVDKSAKVEDAEDQAEATSKAEKDEGFELL